MVTTFSGHDVKLNGAWNAISHIISHIWVLLFPIINLASSVVVLSLTRLHPSNISVICSIINFLADCVTKLYLRKVHQTKQ